MNDPDYPVCRICGDTVGNSQMEMYLHLAEYHPIELFQSPGVQTAIANVSSIAFNVGLTIGDTMKKSFKGKGGN